jgi:4-amino-4-deoxy-L-arabinose transferase-like glycosyltransferase
MTSPHSPAPRAAAALRSSSPLWLVFAAVLLCWNLNYAPLWNPDEGRYAAAALEMAQPFNGAADWIVPHLNSVPRLNKPPLVYWLSAIFLEVFGHNAGAVRLTSVLAALGVLLVVWQLGKRMFGAATGVLAGLVWATSTLPFILSHTLNTDMLLTFTIALALLGLWMMSEEEARSEGQKVRGAALAGIGLGLAMLAKGPVGVVLPIGIWGLARVLTWRRRTFSGFPWLACLVAVILAALISAPWYVAIAQVHPEFLHTFLFGENIARLTGSQFYHKPEPFYFYLPILLIGAFPWTAFLIPAVALLVRDFRRKSTKEDTSSTQCTEQRSCWFLWLWTAVVVGLFSLSHVKLVTYILPAFPALAILIAQAIAKGEERIAPSTQRLMAWAKWVTVALLLILAVVLPIAFFRPKGLASKLIPSGEIAPYIAALCTVMAVTALLLATQRRQRAHVALFGGGAAMFVVLLAGAGHAARYEDTSVMTQALLPYLKPDDVLVQFKTFEPTAIFYANRPMKMIEVDNRSGWDKAAFRTSPYFPPGREAMKEILREAAKDGRRVFVLAKWKYVHFPALANLHIIGISNDYRLLSNRPAPPGFAYEFIAPRLRQRVLSPECKALRADC